MLLTNDPQGRYVNGDIGKVKEIINDGVEQKIMVEFPNKGVKLISPFR
jgi:ATP-dependent exoDNAse (exonuclease V) alpha subunit